MLSVWTSLKIKQSISFAGFEFESRSTSDDKLNDSRVTKSNFATTKVENNVGKEKDPGHFILFSSTGQRPASYCHGVVSVVGSSVCPCVHP